MINTQNQVDQANVKNSIKRGIPMLIYAKSVILSRQECTLAGREKNLTIVCLLKKEKEVILTSSLEMGKYSGRRGGCRIRNRTNNDAQDKKSFSHLLLFPSFFYFSTRGPIHALGSDQFKFIPKNSTFGGNITPYQ